MSYEAPAFEVIELQEVIQNNGQGNGGPSGDMGDKG